ncbi:MAG: ABC transporter permease [Actinomycetota bacterium]|nr:ABC transporter permease [Actinomycetota bacterium]
MRRARRRLRSNPRLVAGLVLLAVVSSWALVADVVSGDPFQPSQALLAPPSWDHPLGTDGLGRDVLSRVLHGAATSLSVAGASVLLATVIGLVTGLIAGYLGGVLDDLLLKVVELFLVIPKFLLALVAAALFGPSMLLLVVILAFVFWPATARLARAEALALRERQFVEAARALGARHSRILARHVLPGVLPVVVVSASFQAGAAVLIEAALAFLGLGDRDVVSWGAMLSDAQAYVALAWWTSLFPGLAVALTVFGTNLAGDGLNDALDVKAAPPAPPGHRQIHPPRRKGHRLHQGGKLPLILSRAGVSMGGGPTGGLRH